MLHELAQQCNTTLAGFAASDCQAVRSPVGAAGMLYVRDPSSASLVLNPSTPLCPPYMSSFRLAPALFCRSLSQSVTHNVDSWLKFARSAELNVGALQVYGVDYSERYGARPGAPGEDVRQ